MQRQTIEDRAPALAALKDLPPDFFWSGPVFAWDEETKRATVTFEIEKAGKVYRRVLVLHEVSTG